MVRADVISAGHTLDRLKTALLAHLQLEDTELYPGLQRLGKATGQPSLQTTADLFASNMKRITDAVTGFLGRYEGKNFDVIAFNRDWKSIVEVLGSRIQSEETTLFPMYEKARQKV